MAYPSHGLVSQVKIEDIGIPPLLALQDGFGTTEIPCRISSRGNLHQGFAMGEDRNHACLRQWTRRSDSAAVSEPKITLIARNGEL